MRREKTAKSWLTEGPGRPLTLTLGETGTTGEFLANK